MLLRNARKFGYTTFYDSVIRLLYQSGQAGLRCVKNNPKISMNASKKDLFLDHDIHSFLVIRVIFFFIVITLGNQANGDVTSDIASCHSGRKATLEGLT